MTVLSLKKSDRLRRGLHGKRDGSWLGGRRGAILREELSFQKDGIGQIDYFTLKGALKEGSSKNTKPKKNRKD